MHGRIHDFIVINTIKNGGAYPTGNSQGAPVREFVGDWQGIEEQPTFKRVLDIGSLDINGNMYDYNYCGAGPNWRDQIGLLDFVGLDLIEGRGVNFVGNAHKMPEIWKDTFDLVMCMSMLEHDTDPQATLNEAYRVLKPGKLFLVTTVDQTHGEHKHLGGGDTETYNFITEEQFRSWLNKAGFKAIDVLHIESDLMASCTK